MGVEELVTRLGPQPRPAVSVLGGAETGIALEDPRSIAEMVLTAVEGALDDAALRWGDVDAIMTASVDLFDGMTASSIAVTEVVGAVMKPETRIAADGLVAAIHAAHQIAAGAYRTVLVVAHGKASMAPHWDLTSWAMDPIFLQPLGVDFLTVAGLQAGLIAGSDPTVVRRWAEQVARRRGAAGGGIAGPVSVDDVLASPMVAAPIRAEMCAPLGDGACAVLLGVPEAGKTKRPVVITGTGHDLSLHYPGDRDLTEWPGLRRACERAYAHAGISQPQTAFHVTEPSCLFPHEEALFVEAAALGEETALSPDGGLFAGTAPVVAGLSRLLRAARAIEGRPGRRALAHGTWGPAGQGQAVAVMEAR
jgi:acetyl-CoA acetyltransferase